MMSGTSAASTRRFCSALQYCHSASGASSLANAATVSWPGASDSKSRKGLLPVLELLVNGCHSSEEIIAVDVVFLSHVLDALTPPLQTSNLCRELSASSSTFAIVRALVEVVNASPQEIGISKLPSKQLIQDALQVLAAHRASAALVADAPTFADIVISAVPASAGRTGRIQHLAAQCAG